MIYVLYVAVSCKMSIYSDKLAHIQVVINCKYSVAQLYTREDTLFHYLGPPFIDDVMIYNTLITYALNMTEKRCLTTLNFAISKRKILNIF